MKKLLLVTVVLLLSWLAINEYNHNQIEYTNNQDRWVSSE